MHSLKELRTQNAARATEQPSRTVNANSGAVESFPSVLATTTPATAMASRTIRTLAPLSSTAPRPAGNDGDGGSALLTTVAAGSASVNIAKEQRGNATRRRWRQKHERDKRDSSGAEDDPAVDGEPPPSRTTAPGGIHDDRDNASVAVDDSGVIAKTRAVYDRRSQSKREDHTADGGKKPTPSMAAGDSGSATSAETPLSARAAPPQEKSKEKLTPLAARRARMEQQKREEAERKEKSPQHEGELGGGRKGNVTEGRSLGDHIPSDNPSASEDFRVCQPGTNAGAGSGAAPSKDEPLLPDSPGSSTEKTLLIESRRIDGGDDAVDSKSLAEAEEGAVGDGEEAAAASEGRFNTVRNRMKKAGQGLNLKAPSPSTLRQGAVESGNISETRRRGGKGGWGAGRFKRKPASAATATTATTSANPKEGGDAGEEATSDGDGAGDSTVESESRGGQQQNNQRDSDTASIDSGISPSVEKAESNDTDDSDGSGRGQRKGWRKAKKPVAGALPAANKEVTLGHVVDRKMREMGYIRKPAVDELKSRRSLRDRVAAERAPEVHVIGEILGAEGFGSGVSCRFRVEGGRHWTCLAGLEEGQTHVVYVDNGESCAAWNHPLDLHYTTKSIQGWPRLMIQVWQLDMHGRNVLQGYGFRHLPSTPGFSEVSVPCWRPTGSMQEETAVFFLGVTPQLTSEDAVFNRAWDQRCRLVTLPAGTVWIQMNNLFRNLHDQDLNLLPRC